MEKGQKFIEFVHNNWWILLLSLAKLFRMEDNFSGSFFSDIVIIALILFGAMYLYWTIFYGVKNFNERFVREASFDLVKNGRDKSNFTKNWIYSFSAANENFLLTFLKDGSLEKDSVLKIFKLMGGFYLYMFLVDERSITFFDKNEISKQEFEKQITATFIFDNQDINNYKKMKDDINTDLQSFFSSFHKQILEILQISSAIESNKSFANAMIFPQVLHSAYDSFFEILTGMEQNK